ncbi:MAG: 2OG-Fe(II) oxygenase [Pseudomonadota bacterium]
MSDYGLIGKENDNSFKFSPHLAVGVRPPMFKGLTRVNPQFAFETIARGQYVVLSFFGSSNSDSGASFLRKLLECRNLFDDDRASFFGVSTDPADYHKSRIEDQMPGIRFFYDLDQKIQNLYKINELYPPLERSNDQHLLSLILDPNLRVLKRFDTSNPALHANEVFDTLMSLSSPHHQQNFIPKAPVLRVPRVFEREFCQHLISIYEENGGTESGFMRQVDNKTVAMSDHSFKRRRDCEITQGNIRDAICHRLFHRLVPEIEKAFHFKCTRIERYIVACYDSESGGYFKPHRDNTTAGTAHRKFAVTINLNAENYEGGNLRFPEYDLCEYRAGTGEAIVFSCSLQHEAKPIISGKRYAVLPFLYNEEAAKIRQQNKKDVVFS